MNRLDLVCDSPERQRCRSCGGVFDRDAFFRKDHRRAAHISAAREFRPTCIGCEQTARTNRKKADGWLEKARSTISRHAKKYGRPVREFTQMYGWDAPRVAHILEHAFDNTCAYCREPYQGMPNSQWQVTIDIIDPKKHPFLETNVQPCCQTCNREKSTTDPELWARKLRSWADWERHQRTAAVPAVQLTLELDVGTASVDTTHSLPHHTTNAARGNGRRPVLNQSAPGVGAYESLSSPHFAYPQVDVKGAVP